MTAMNDPVDRLRKKHPGWTVWRSDAGHWYGTNSAVTMAQLRDGCSATVDAETVEGLDEEIAAQERQRAAVPA